MANYYTYGEIPDVEQAFSGGLDFVSRADLLDQMPAFSAPATIAPSSGGGSSAPTWYRWSDGTYNRNPESTGIRTPYDQLPDQYKQIDSRRSAAPKEAPPPSAAQPPELVTEPDKGFMRTGPGAPVGGLTPLPEEPPVGPPPLSLLDDEGLTPAPEGPSGLGSRPSQELPVTAPAIAAPSQELNRPQALPSARVAPEPPVNLFVEGADVPEGTGLNLGALDELFANLRKTEELQKLALEPGLLQQGFTGTSGVTAPPSGAGIFATPTAPAQAPIDFEVTPEMAGALQAVARPADITAAERQAVTSNPRVQALQRISDQLKANDFAGAFNTALAAEQELGGDFVGNIIDSNKMRSLRGPMTAEEITKFYNEMPESVFTERYLGPGNEFKKEQAIERNIAALGGQAGYVDPMLGVKKEETLLSKLPIEEMAALAALAMGATAIPGLFGAGAGGAGGAGAAGATGAGAAGAAGGAGALTGVVPTGLIPGAVSAAGLGTATFPIIASGGLTASQIAALTAAGLGGAGALTSGSVAAPTTTTTPTPEPPLEEVVVTGTRPPVIPPAAVVGGLAGTGALVTRPPVVEPPLEEVVVEAKKPVQPEVSVPPPIIPPATPAQPVAPEAPLEEVTVQAKKPVEPPVVVPPPVVPTTTPATPTVPEGPLEEVVVEAKKPVEPELSVPPPVLPSAPPTAPTAPEAPLEEVTVQAKRPTETPIVVPPVTPTPTSPIDTAFPEAPLEEVVIEAKRPVEPPIVVPPIVPPPTTPIDTAFPEAPLEEVVIETKRPVEPPVVVPPIVPPPTTPIDTAFPEGPVEEVVVETTKPTEPPVVVPPIVPPPTTPIDTAFPEGPVEEVVVETTKPTPEKPIIPPVVVPTTTPVDIPKEPTKINEPNKLQDELKALMDKYANLENLLKLLGALGAAGAKTPTTPVTKPTAPSLGGALPKYVYTRKQLSPDIDYYTYGTRPEAKFFEDTVQLEKPVQPELPPAKTPEEDKPMATGGLTGYAGGGSNETRYFDGPGSGRDDKIPALLSDGEYVMDAETLALLGDGSTKEGARRMDKFRANIRKHKGRALSRGQISPDAKSPDKYMGGGLA